MDQFALANAVRKLVPDGVGGCGGRPEPSTAVGPNGGVGMRGPNDTVPPPEVGCTPSAPAVGDRLGLAVGNNGDGATLAVGAKLGDVETGAPRGNGNLNRLRELRLPRSRPADDWCAEDGDAAAVWCNIVDRSAADRTVRLAGEDWGVVALAVGASNDDGRRPGAGELTTGTVPAVAAADEDNKYIDRGVPVPPPPTELPPGSVTGCCCGVLGVTSIRGGC
jgi:hypothetical protein